MPYTPQTWIDGPGGGTPISAARLNYMEDGIEAALEPTDYLGKPTVSGYGGTPWFYDPASASWGDAGNWGVRYYTPDQTLTFTLSGDDQSAGDSVVQIGAQAASVSRAASLTCYTDDDSFTKFTVAETFAQINRDGTGSSARIGVRNEDVGFARLQYSSSGYVIQAQANVGQGASLLDLKNSDGTSTFYVTPDGDVSGDGPSILRLSTAHNELYLQQTGGNAYIDLEVTASIGRIIVQAETGQTAAALEVIDSSGTADVLLVTGDNRIGFYDHAPIAQQTGVAVSAAGIHAALVALGLITA